MAAANTTTPQPGSDQSSPAQALQTLDTSQQMQGAAMPQQTQGTPGKTLYTDFASI